MANISAKYKDSYLNYLYLTMGLTIDKELGSGAWGDAFLTSNGKVLKFTTDEDEAIAAKYLKDKPLNHVANVDEILYLIINNGEYLSSCYAIIKEFVPFDDELKDILNRVYITGAVQNFNSERFIERAIEENTNINEDKIRQLASMCEEWKSAGFKTIDAHRGNIGLTSNGTVKLFDFGANNTEMRLEIPEIKIQYAEA